MRLNNPPGASIVLIYSSAPGSRYLLGVTRKGTTNNWSLPGGKLESLETWEEAAVREVREEVGLEVSDLELVYEAPSCTESKRPVKTFRAGTWLGKPRAVEPTTCVDWLTWDTLLSRSNTLSPYYTGLFNHLFLGRK